MREFFDAMEDEDLLAPTLKAYATIAQIYPTIFLPFFNDLVDIMVGWFVDETISDRSRNVLAATFRMFGVFFAQADNGYTAENRTYGYTADITQRLLVDVKKMTSDPVPSPQHVRRLYPPMFPFC